MQTDNHRTVCDGYCRGGMCRGLQGGSDPGSLEGKAMDRRFLRRILESVTDSEDKLATPSRPQPLICELAVTSK